MTAATPGWLVVGAALLVVGLVSGRPDVGVLGLPLLLGAAWSLARPPRGATRVRLRASDQPAGTTGVRAQVAIEPAAASGTVTLRMTAPGHRTAEVLLAAGERSVVASMRSVRTGRRPLFGLDYRAAGPDQLLGSAAVTVPRLVVTVLPSTRAVEDLPLPFRLQGLAGNHVSRRSGDGGDLRDVGPFMPGDRLRRVDWRVTARLNSGPPPTTGQRSAPISQLYVRRTFATADATVMLVVDSRDDVGPRVSTWGDATLLREDEATSLDIARNAAATLARHYLAGGDRVGLEDLGRMRRPIPPAGGRKQQQRLTLRLALAEPEGEPTPRKRVPRLPSGALIIVFSTFLDDDAARMAQSWRRAGHRVIAVDTLPRLLLGGLPERLETAFRIVAMERADRLRELPRTGVEVMTWSLPGRAGVAAAADNPAIDLVRLARVRARR